MWETALTSILGMTAKSLNLATVEIPDVEGNLRTGIILKTDEIPADVPWTHVSIERRVETDINTGVLDRSQQLRQGHSKCVMDDFLKKEWANRSAPLRAGGLSKTRSWAQVLHAKEERDRQLTINNIGDQARQSVLDEEADGIAGSAANMSIQQSGSLLADPTNLFGASPAPTAASIKTFRGSRWSNVPTAARAAETAEHL